MSIRRIALGIFAAACVLLGQQPAFEVASIKPSPPLNPADVAAGKLHVGISIDGARVDIGFLSLADLIPIAYKLKRYQVSGPDWMPVQRFDILAKLPDGASEKQVPEMLQALLADRFKLAIHRENKERSVYALVVGKDGPKLKEAAPSQTPSGGDDKTAGDGNGQVSLSRAGNGAVVSSPKMGKTKVSMGANGTMHMEVEHMGMSDFAAMLAPFLDRPVVDMTELKGNYQIALDVSMADLRNVAKTAGMAIPGQAPTGGDAARNPADAASEPSGSSIFAAVQQLGLKLESRKTSIEVIVVDHVEKNPTEN
jgi:uncharacterized protein (TIGR03435 family)